MPAKKNPKHEKIPNPRSISKAGANKEKANEATKDSPEGFGSPEEMPLSAYRVKLVEIAAQMASAQIGANFQGKTSEQLIPLNSSSLDPIFRGAMLRAQSLLDTHLNDPTVVHVEQLFVPSTKMTESAIGEELERWQWPVLRNRAAFHSYMERLETWFHDHIVSELFSDESDSRESYTDLLASVLDLGRRMPQNEWSRKILEITERHVYSITHVTEEARRESLPGNAWRYSVIRMCFGEREPGRRDVPNKKIIRRYLPWGIFRYLRLWGADDEEGSSLASMLCTERKSLKLWREPYPTDPDFNSRWGFSALEDLEEYPHD